MPIGAPGPREVAGSTLASLISPGTELAWAFQQDCADRLPLELGYASVFRVDAIGADVHSISVGDVVLSTGPHADWQVLPEDHVVRVPSDLDSRVAVFARLMNVPLSVLHVSSAPHGGDALVIGLGLIGQCMVRVLERVGFAVTAVDDDPKRRSLAPVLSSALNGVTPDSADLVIDCTGQDSRVLDAARAARQGGELVLAGVPWRPRAGAPIFDLSRAIFDKSLTVHSGFEWQVPLMKDIRAGRSDARDQMSRALRWLADGQIDVNGLAARILPAEVIGAYESLRARTAPTLSYVVDWSMTDDIIPATRLYHAGNIN